MLRKLFGINGNTQILVKNVNKYCLLKTADPGFLSTVYIMNEERGVSLLVKTCGLR